MCLICLEFDKTGDVEDYQHMIRAARRETGVIDPVHLEDLETTLMWLLEEVE